MHLPVLSANNIKLTADTVLVVKGARLDVSCCHEVEWRVGRLVRVIYFEIVAAKSKHVLWILTTLH